VSDRLARRLWLLSPESGWTGNGQAVLCAFPECEEVLTVDTVTVDRWPLAGALGGTYARDNIRPACARHNYGGGSMVARLKAVMEAIQEGLVHKPLPDDFHLIA
jgi:hypothetical protein